MTDDDDWVGTPPEGRHTRDRANPGFWAQNQKAVTYVFFGLFLFAIVVVLLAL
jgi:hypothetical protein